MAKLKLKKFIELKKDEHKIFVVEQDEEGNVSPDALFIESDICDDDILNKTVGNYRIADENDIYHGAEENSLCVELEYTEPKQRATYERNLWYTGHITLDEFVSHSPRDCEPQHGCTNVDCPFYMNGTCAWLELVQIGKAVKREQLLKVKKGGIN